MHRTGNEHKLFAILPGMKRQNANEIIGWIGVIAILASYSLLSLGLVNGDSLYYHALILVGSLFVALISLKKRAYQPFVLNSMFFILAITALIRLTLL